MMSWRRRYLKFVDTDSEGREGIEEGDIVFEVQSFNLARVENQLCESQHFWGAMCEPQRASKESDQTQAFCR